MKFAINILYRKLTQISFDIPEFKEIFDLLNEIKQQVMSINPQKISLKKTMTPLLNSEDVLAILKISKSKLDRLETKGVIPYAKIGGRRKYREDDIMKYMDKLFK